MPLSATEDVNNAGRNIWDAYGRLCFSRIKFMCSIPGRLAPTPLTLENVASAEPQQLFQDRYRMFLLSLGGYRRPGRGGIHSQCPASQSEVLIAHGLN